MTGWAVLGLEAAGVNPLDLDHGDATPISYLAGNVGEISTTGDIERTILVLRGAGLDPRALPGRRPGQPSAGAPRRGRLLGRAGEPDRVRDPRAEGRRRDVRATRARRPGCGRTRTRTAAGASPPGSASDADTTGAVLQALAAAGSRRRDPARGVSYLRGVQRPGGGFPLERRRGQRPVHRLGGPGAGRRGRLAVLGAQGRQLPARLPRLASRPATATTATRPRATRPRSGSPGRR